MHVGSVYTSAYLISLQRLRHTLVSARDLLPDSDEFYLGEVEIKFQRCMEHSGRWLVRNTARLSVWPFRHLSRESDAG